MYLYMYIHYIYNTCTYIHARSNLANHTKMASATPNNGNTYYISNVYVHVYIYNIYYIPVCNMYMFMYMYIRNILYKYRYTYIYRMGSNCHAQQIGTGIIHLAGEAGDEVEKKEAFLIEF